MSSSAAQPAPIARRMVIERVAAGAAALGGAAWLVKSGMIFATGDEPPLAFAVGLVLFPFALLGLRSTLGADPGRAGRIGGAVAAIAAASGVLTVLVRAVGGESVVPAEDDVTLLTPFVVVAGFGTFVALIALGIAVRRRKALAQGYTLLPLAMGLAAIPLMFVGGALEAVSERLFEVPIALLGLGWIGIAIALWSAPATDRRTARR